VFEFGRDLTHQQEPNCLVPRDVWRWGTTLVSERLLGSNDCSKIYSTEGITIYWAIHIFFISVFKQRSGESVKVHQLDVAIPLHLKSQLRKGPPLGGGEGETESADTMPFVMLTRKGNKQHNFICYVHRRHM